MLNYGYAFSFNAKVVVCSKLFFVEGFNMCSGTTVHLQVVYFIS